MKLNAILCQVNSYNITDNSCNEIQNENKNETEKPE